MLPKIPDRRKTYYKITNQEENHCGLQYRDGLIVGHQKFNNNPKDSCVKGGIYFTTKEHLHKFFNYGCWIRPIKIPSDAKVILDLIGNKYRADKLFFKPRKSFNFYFDELFDRKTFTKENYWRLTIYYSKYFNIWFDEKTFPKQYYWYIVKHCSEYFSTWFNKEIFPKKDYWSLAKYCSNRFDNWFDKKTFPKENYWSLAKYCSEYKHIWDK